MNSFVAEERPRIVVRVIIGAAVLFLLWFLGGTIISFFTGSSEERVSARVGVSGSSNVDVSLQGNDTQRAENDLRLYEGDSLMTRSGGQASLTFFDGTRVQLDQNTNVEIAASNKRAAETSEVTLNVTQGRVWITTPDLVTYSGAITRSVVMDNFRASVPADASGLLANDLILFEQAAGLGVDVTLTLPESAEKHIMIGEGQVLSLDENARKQIAAGTDPYAFRDAIVGSELTDAFIVTAMARSNVVIGTGSGTSSVQSDDSTTDLSVTSPQNGDVLTTETVAISGRVGPRVATVTANGYDIPVRVDRTFSQQLALPANTSMTLTIQAKGADGLVLAEVTRNVQRQRTALGLATITKPAGSGATFTTDLTELEITGTVPANTAGVMVNDYRLQLFKPGDRNWSYLASIELGNMKTGENLYSVRTIDQAGMQSAPVTLKIVHQSEGQTTSEGQASSTSSSSAPLLNNAPLTPGILSVVAPTAGTSAETTEDEVLIEGKTSTSTHAVYVNDYKLSLYEPGKDFWNYIASEEFGTLKSGTNTYKIVARNEKGEILDAIQYTITKK